MKGKHVLAIAWLLLIITFLTGCAGIASAGYATGAWDNFDFSKPVDYWISAARSWGGDATVLDLAVAQAQDGYAALPFPYSGCGTLRGASDTDLLEPYLNRLDSEGIGVILSIQPMDADITGLIGIILDRYGHHRCLKGINVDLEWKRTGTPQHASNQERDAWTAEIDRHNPQLKLFMTYFKDYTCFPDDDGRMVVMYDGTQDTQENLLKAYGELARHFSAAGIYTGYSTNRPPAASNEAILAAAPNTQYIIHTDDVRSAGQSSGTGTISMPSTLFGKTGFGNTGLSSKISTPSSLFSNSAGSGFPSIGGFGPSAFKKMDIFKSADQGNTGGASTSLVNMMPVVQKTTTGSSEGISSPFGSNLVKGFSSFSGFGKRLFS